jgi:hypothetical protein
MEVSAMSIVYFIGAALFFAICQGFAQLCDSLKESGQ